MFRSEKAAGILLVRWINLTLLLLFAPIGIVGGSLHDLVHRHRCLDHSVAADFLAWFDASNQLLERGFQAVERQLEQPGDVVTEIASADSRRDNCCDDPSECWSGHQGPELRSTGHDSPIGYVANSQNEALELADLLSCQPTRAGPKFVTTHSDCDGDCQLCVSLRQLSVSPTASCFISDNQHADWQSSLYIVDRPAAVRSGLSSRGPPLSC